MFSELPSKPVIFDEFGKEITGVAGPYTEGGEIKLICSVDGGEFSVPRPRVSYRNLRYSFTCSDVC